MCAPIFGREDAIRLDLSTPDGGAQLPGLQQILIIDRSGILIPGRGSGDTIPNSANRCKRGVMPRLSRVVLPGYAHHVTQRGVRRGDVFFTDDDRSFYLRLMREQTGKFEVTILSYCLMTNHVHPLAVPASAAGLARAIGEAHRRYTLHINRRMGATGYLFQGRFASCALASLSSGRCRALCHAQSGARRFGRTRGRLSVVERGVPCRRQSERCSGAAQRFAGPVARRTRLASTAWRQLMENDAEVVESQVEHVASNHAHRSALRIGGVRRSCRTHRGTRSGAEKAGAGQSKGTTRAKLGIVSPELSPELPGNCRAPNRKLREVVTA